MLASDAPVEAEEFRALMAAFAPFEAAPFVAVAVSGGADSLALTVLLHRWAQERGGGVLALTVDHGLRAESAAEAALVGAWLALRGIEHRILVWQGEKPATGIQAAARQARYALLAAACADRGILHLAIAHHAGDQGETLLARLARGSGVDGLSAMAPVVETGPVRLIRPLLGLERCRLEATLKAQGQDWVQDPSNADDHYQRVRLRRLLAREGADLPRLGATARALGRARAALEVETARLLVQGVALHEAGFARLDRACFLAAPAEIALRALAGLVRTIGGRDYPPRMEGLERLLAALEAGRPASLCGCALAMERGGVLVYRERRHPALPMEVARLPLLWDGRFTVSLEQGRAVAAPLQTADWSRIRDEAGLMALPARVRPTLPAFHDEAGLRAVPHLGYWRDAREAGAFRVVFTPKRPLAGVAHCLV